MTKVTKQARSGGRKLAAILAVAAGVGGTLNVQGQTATLDTVGNIETLYTASYWSNNISPTNELAASWDYVAAKSGMRMPETQLEFTHFLARAGMRREKARQPPAVFR